MVNKVIQVFNLGRLEYSKCFKIQKHFLDQHLNGAINDALNTLLLVEHDPPVYTIGIRRAKYLEKEMSDLRKLNAQVELTDRGGLITFHGIGQLVAYPIINLKNYQASIKWYVSQLESVVINLCKEDLNLEAYRLCNSGANYTGVWLNDKKLAAIGVHCKRYITYHGLALNCDIDLNWFKHIIPCGIEDKEVTSLTQQLGKPTSVDTIMPMFVKQFEKQFKSDLIIKTKEEIDQLKILMS